MKRASCHTQEEIAAAEEMPQRTISDIIKDFSENGKLAKSAKTTAEYLDDFAPKGGRRRKSPKPSA
jgi:hypothetical protein